MNRHIEKDEFGGNVVYKLKSKKKCPICRMLVQQDDVNHIKDKYMHHPELEDNSYNNLT